MHSATMKFKFTVFVDVMPCNLVGRY